MFKGYRNLVDRRMLNCGVELKGVKLTKWQLEGLKAYVKYDPVYRFAHIDVDENGLIIVDEYPESDLILK